MLRRAHENGISQPTNQSISQNKDTAETKLNCIALLSISGKINYFYFYCFGGMGWQGGGMSGSKKRINRWFYFGQKITYPIMKKDRTIKQQAGIRY